MSPGEPFFSFCSVVVVVVVVFCFVFRCCCFVITVIVVDDVVVDLVFYISSFQGWIGCTPRKSCLQLNFTQTLSTLVINLIKDQR